MKTIKARRIAGAGWSNTGYKGITLTSYGNQDYYRATNKNDGKIKKFYINGQRTREQAFMRAMAFVNN